jgi:hypothetical protein
MDRYITSADMKQFVETNPELVTCKQSSYDNVYVLKYKRKVFYDNLWNDFLEECRGTLVDKDYNVVSRPFTKIYNYGVEENAPKLDDATRVRAFRKVNGFMVAITWHNGDILVSTTGSTDSDFVKMAYDHIDIAAYREVCHNWNGYTFMFECVHENDPHIIQEKTGMYVLGFRKNSWISNVEVDPGVLYVLAKQFNCYTPEFIETNVCNLIRLAKCVKHEGYVAYTANGYHSFKIKSPFYLVSKLMARVKDTSKLLGNNVKNRVDEEFYPLVDHIKSNVESFEIMTEQQRLQLIREFLGS